MAKVTVVKQENYTVIDNGIFKDTRLSFKAKGILTTMLSLPPTWNYTIEGLKTLAKDGKDSIKTALKELENFGYLERKQVRNDDGSFCDLEYFVYEKPQTKYPKVENPQTDKSLSEKPLQLNTNILSTNKSNTDLPRTEILNTEKEKAETLSKDNGEADTSFPKKRLPVPNKKKTKEELKELEMDMFKRFGIIGSLYDTSEMAYENIIRAFRRYLNRYTERTGKVHPILKDETLENIFVTLATISDTEYNHFDNVSDYEPDNNGLSYLDKMVDEYFDSEHSDNTDWHISHFARQEYLEKMAQHIVDY